MQRKLHGERRSLLPRLHVDPRILSYFFGFVSYGTTFDLDPYLFMDSNESGGQVELPHSCQFCHTRLCVSFPIHVYMESRTELRKILWSNAGVVERIQAIKRVGSEVKPSASTNWTALCCRCSFESKYLHGLKHWNSLTGIRTPIRRKDDRLCDVSWVPRLIWKDKPKHWWPLSCWGSTLVYDSFLP